MRKLAKTCCVALLSLAACPMGKVSAAPTEEKAAAEKSAPVKAPARPAEITAQRSEEGVVVKIDGQPFAEYRIRSGSKPIVWPIRTRS